MSISTELTRMAQNAASVNAAKTAIASAITAKGGTVGASDGLEDFAAAIAGIPSGGLHFNVVEVQGSGANSITVNIPNTAGTACWAFYETDYSGKPDPAVMIDGENALFVSHNYSFGHGRDSGNASRSPSMSRQPDAGTIKFTSTRAFTSEATYRVVYLEFHEPEPEAPMLLLAPNPDELNPEDALNIITGGEDR